MLAIVGISDRLNIENFGPVGNKRSWQLPAISSHPGTKRVFALDPMKRTPLIIDQNCHLNRTLSSRHDEER